MKKLLLLGGFTFMTLGLSAQQRLSLYEEFTGENCPPCANLNPGLMATVNNHDEVLIIKYQVPIPTGGPIYAQNTADAQARMSYYSVNFAPYGRLDGKIVGEGFSSAGNVAYTSHEMLEAAYNQPTTIDVSIVGYDRTLGSNTVTFDVEVTSTVAQDFTNAVLHVALIENLIYNTSPGTNGETEFYNVVRKMYPNAQGQAIQGSFTANQTQSFTITAELPSYVDPNNPDLRFVAFVQDNTNKKVLNADVSNTIDVDAYSLSLSSPHSNEILCGAQSNLSVVSHFKNVGEENITSAEIFYRVSDGQNNGPWTSGVFNGNLAPNQSTSFQIDNIEGLEGVFAIEDSIGKINGAAISNPQLKSSFVVLRSLSTQAQDLFPYSNNFELLANRTEIFSAPINSVPFEIYQGSGMGYDGSSFFLAYLNYGYPAGVSGVALLPLMNLPEGNKTLEFYVAYAQYSNENDQLEVVYSTDCGTTWNSVWSKSGSDLATVAPRTGEFLPNSNSQYRKEEVDLSSVPNGAYIGFRATSDYGNHLFVDNVWLRSGAVSTDELVNEASLMLFPNPASNSINLKIEHAVSGNYDINVLDVLGRQVYQSSVEVNGGIQTIQISIEDLPAGMYTLQFSNELSNQQIKFTKK